MNVSNDEIPRALRGLRGSIIMKYKCFHVNGFHVTQAMNQEIHIFILNSWRLFFPSFLHDGDNEIISN